MNWYHGDVAIIYYVVDDSQYNCIQLSLSTLFKLAAEHTIILLLNLVVSLIYSF